MAGKNDAKTREGNLRGDDGSHFFEYLTIGYRKTGADTRFLQKGSDFFRLQDDGDAMVVENIPDHLYLWQDESPGWSLGINRGDQQHDVPGGK